MGDVTISRDFAKHCFKNECTLAKHSIFKFKGKFKWYFISSYYYYSQASSITQPPTLLAGWEGSLIRLQAVGSNSLETTTYILFELH